MRDRTESCTCPCCHSGMFSMVDRLERLDMSTLARDRKAGHRYWLVCENCGAESDPFFILPAGAIEGTVTGVVGQAIEMGKEELERLPEADQQPIVRSAS